MAGGGGEAVAVSSSICVMASSAMVTLGASPMMTTSRELGSALGGANSLITINSQPLTSLSVRKRSPLLPISMPS